MNAHPRLTWFWQLEESNKILYTHATKVYQTMFVSRSLAKEYKLQKLLPALAWAGIPTAEVRIKDCEPVVTAKNEEYWKVKALMQELSEVKAYKHEEERMGAIAAILQKYRKAPRNWWQLGFGRRV